MSADKNLFTPAALLTAAYLRDNSSCENTAGLMQVFDEMYDYLDCYSRHKNEAEPMSDIRTWLKSFYNEDEAARPRWHHPV